MCDAWYVMTIIFLRNKIKFLNFKLFNTQLLFQYEEWHDLIDNLCFNPEEKTNNTVI